MRISQNGRVVTYTGTLGPDAIAGRYQIEGLNFTRPWKIDRR
jgi:hypothetical protein